MKVIRILSHLAFVFYAVLCFLYYKERIFFADTSFLLFFLTKGEFVAGSGRYGSYFTQILPMLAIQLKFSLPVVAMIYSVSFALVYYLIFLLCTSVLKNIEALFLIPAILVFCCRMTFYFPVTEIFVALSFCVLLHSWLVYKNPADPPGWLGQAKRNPIVNISILFVLVLLCHFSHPTTIFAVTFLLIYRILSIRSEYFQKLSQFGLLIKSAIPEIITLAFAVLVFYLKTKTVEAGSYEDEQLHDFRNALLSISSFFSFDSVQFITRHIQDLYYFPFILFAAGLMYHLIKKEYLKAVWILGSGSVFLIASLLTYKNGNAEFMMEKNFMPLAFFLVFPFAVSFPKYFLQNDLHQKKERNSVYYINLVFISAFFIFLFYNLNLIKKERHFFTNRITYLTQLLNASGPLQKIILLQKDADYDKIWIPWSVPIETLFLSSLEGKEKTKTIFIPEPQTDGKFDPNATDVFLGPYFWLKWKPNELNANYFSLPDAPYDTLFIKDKQP